MIISSLLILVALGFAYRSGQAPQLTTTVTRLQSSVSSILSGNVFDHVVSQERPITVVKGATPAENIVQGVKLADTYYYHYNRNLSAAGRRVFAAAVAAYNRTGVVHLKAGTAPAGSNAITFGVYHKAMPRNQTAIELGHGGPEVIQAVSTWGTRSHNHATASLNGDYPEAYSLTVAMHELGHALGLGHSTAKNSIMYPYSQGVTQLSKADVTGLKSIYQQKP